MDHLDEPIRMLVSRRSLATLHHLFGAGALDDLAATFADELRHQLDAMKSTGDYAKIADETDADLLRQAARQEKDQS